jgi:hypothetical protein
MSKVEDGGGFAFPQPGVYDGGRDEVNPVGAYYDAGGMSLRDYFAAKAMQGYLAAGIGRAIDNPDHLAQWAYENADAMLEARKK